MYRYANNDPVNYCDPDGRLGKGIHQGAIKGDYFNPSNTTQGVGKFIGQVGVGLVPGLGQAADVRDMSAAINTVRTEGLNWRTGIGVAAGGIAFIPGVGDAARSVVKPLFGKPASAVGRVTGARTTTLQPWDFDAAESAYNVIRASTGDVMNIASNTGMRNFQIDRIKDHLFNRTHRLDRGVARFDADPAIANAWNRLQSGTHNAGDIQLLKHELFEAKFEGIFKTNYRSAHDAANRAGRPSGLE